MILLTGATGFLGSKLAIELINNNYSLCCICRESSSFERVADIYNKIMWINNNPNDLLNVFENYGIDVIIHCATNYGRTSNSMVGVINSNVCLPLSLIDYASKYNVKLFINTDSFFTNELNGAWKEGESVYLNNYVKSKFIFKEIIRENMKDYNFAFVNAKLHHIYGGEDGDGKFVSFLTNALRNNVKHIELSEGKQGRDWIHISDVISAYTCIINNMDVFKSGEFYNYEIGTGIETPVRDFCIKAKEISKSTSILDFGKKSLNNNELSHAVADITAMQQLGWTPKITLEEGIRRLFV